MIRYAKELYTGEMKEPYFTPKAPANVQNSEFTAKQHASD